MSQTSSSNDLDKILQEENCWKNQTQFSSNGLKPPEPPVGATNFGDSSGPLFSIYSKAAEDEDNKMIERWQKDADGIIIFTGLFTAALATLLAVTVQDLRPNGQDTSSFYLGNIYQILADPNVTHPSIPSSVTKPPPFSPPRYAVWVNSLWFLSLVMSLSCALLATLLRQWARRYLRLTRPSQCGPEKRARMRAFFANGVDSMHVQWVVEGLPTLLHLSVFFFFGGLVIFLFNNDHEVFGYVISWIGLFSIVYGSITLLPLIRHDSPYDSPLSATAWFLYTSISYLIFKGLIFMKSGRNPTWTRWFDLQSRHPHYFRLRDRYRRWIFAGVENAAEETASDRSSEIDIQILDWTVSTLGDDDLLKNFFESIPGFFNSKMLKHLKNNIPLALGVKFLNALHGFWDRAWTSNSISDSEKARRLDISLNAMDQTYDRGVWSILYDIGICNLMDVPLTVEIGHAVAHWCTSDYEGASHCARSIVSAILVLTQRERDKSWVDLATRAFGPLEPDVLDSVADGADSMLLAILIKVAHQSIPSDRIPMFLGYQRTLAPLSLLNIHNTLPRLQHTFCALWNVIFTEASTLRPNHIHMQLLKLLRRPYITLHQGTDAALTAFSASTPAWDGILNELSSYPFCHLPSHRAPLPTQPRHPSGASPRTISQQNSQEDTFEWLLKHNHISCYPKTTSQIEEGSPGPNKTPLSTNPVHSSAHPAETSFCPPEGNERQQGVTAQCYEPDASQIPPIVYILEATSGLAPEFTPPTRIITLPCIPTPASPPTSTVVDLAVPPTGSFPLSHLRPRGLVNSGNMCFAIAVLQILVHSPPPWNLFRKLCELKEQRGALESPETGGGSTALVDVTMRFFEEFTLKEKEKYNSVVDSFEPTYLYDMMKESMSEQLKKLLDGQVQDAKEFLDLYLQALAEELSQSNYTDERRPGFTTNVDGSPIAHIFGGRSRSTVRKSNQREDTSTEDWRSLEIDIQPDSENTVQDALACISQPQSVQGGPSDSGDGSLEVLIEALPPILVLQLKRFRFDASAGGVIKIGKYVKFAPELEIPLDVMVPTTQRPSEPPHYRLYAVLYYHGETANGGHYTVDILHGNGDGNSGEGWLHFDNEAVSPVHHRDVFGGQNNGPTAVERCAYLLFYCHTGTPTET